MTRIHETCAKCGRVIGIGDEYFCSDLTDGLLFCSCDCMREHIESDAELNGQVIDEWMETNAEGFELDSGDPYDRYGVSERDFL